MEYSEEGVVTVMKRAEIDTRAPFRSVKEAVTLFGEKVLAGEVYANKLKEMHREASENRHGPSKIVTVTAELEETKQSLQKAKEESTMMANYLSSLRQELDRTKRELQQMKGRESEKEIMEFEIDQDIKIVEDSTTTKFEVKKLAPESSSTTDHHHHYDHDHDRQDAIHELQKKRYVTFANPPSLAQVMVPKGVETLERHPSLKKKKKKPLIPLIGAIFSRKKGAHQDHIASPRI